MAPISILVSNGKGRVWNVDDIATLRADHKICSMLTGTLPHMGSQNIFLGLPLQLLPEEVVLLVDQELAILVDDVAGHLRPSSEHLDRWRKEHSAYVASVSAVDDTASVKSSHFADTEVVLQKRLARQQRKKAIDDARGAAENVSPWIPEPPKEQADSAVPRAQYPLIIPGKTDFGWYDNGFSTYTSIHAAKAAKIWSYPSTERERAICAVFADLWKKGYVMGGGIKFGGEYLVYPGDPLRYHSHYAATVLPSLESPLFPMDIVAHGRLGTATKKAHLLCGWDEKQEEGVYFSIEWAGFG